jgi:hypothetical protein
MLLFSAAVIFRGCCCVHLYPLLGAYAWSPAPVIHNQCLFIRNALSHTAAAAVAPALLLLLLPDTCLV